MSLHKDLTGAELHEPKGADEAAADTVYVADGEGSGEWAPLYDGILTLNKHWLHGDIPDIGIANAKTFIYVPYTAKLFEIAAIIDAPLTTANAVLSIYINSVLFADTLTLTQAGSFAGQLKRAAISTSPSIPAGSVIEIRSDGGPDSVVPTTVILGLQAQS